MSELIVLAITNKTNEIGHCLENGADINQQDSGGQTALFCACLKNYTQIGATLLKNNKINVNLQNNHRWSPFYTSCWHNKFESALLMLQDARVDINLDGNYGWSPLMVACWYGNTQIVQLLLSYGRYIDIHKKSTTDAGYIKSGSTALDMAKQSPKRNTDIVQLLEQYQKNPKETQKLWRNELNLKGKKK